MLAVIPVWAVSAGLLLANWPWMPVVMHLAVLSLLGIIAADVSLYRFRKIPFTCTYQPGKSQVHLVFLACYGFLLLVFQAARWEQTALASPAKVAATLAALCAVAVLVRRQTAAMARSEWEGVQFEDSAPAVVLRLGLNRDGASV